MLAARHFKLSLNALRYLSTAVAVPGGRGGRSSVSDKTVTVFGATGRLGRILVNSLGQTGTQVVCPHRSDPQYAIFLRLCGDLGVIHLVHMRDFGSTEAIEETVRYSDVVVNLTGSDARRVHWTLEQSNVDLTHRIARACKNVGVPTFIHLSHINAAHNSPSLFLRTKALSEEVVRHELPDSSIIVRASDCFGVKDRFSINLCARNQGISYSRGLTFLWHKGERTFKQPVYGPDVMKGIAKICLMHDDDRQRLYQFIGPKEYSLNEFMQAIVDITYRPYWPVHNPFSKFIAKNFLPRGGDVWIRYQTITDEPEPGLPGLLDVGITPTAFEDVALLWLRSYRSYWNTYDPIDGHRTDVSAHPLGTGEL